MIVRVLRLTVRAGKVGAFNAIFRQQLGLLQQQSGLVYAKFARRLNAAGGEDAILFEEWRDAASMYAWVGSDLLEPRLIPGVRELVDDVVVAHYEALAEDGPMSELPADAQGRSVGDEAAGS